MRKSPGIRHELMFLGIHHGPPATGLPGQAIGLTTIYGPTRLAGLGLHRWYTHLVYLQQ
jgi:hypothetical protein